MSRCGGWHAAWHLPTTARNRYLIPFEDAHRGLPPRLLWVKIDFVNYERITINYSSGKVRWAVRSGRSYVVAPATIIVQGVLNGSQGALFYPNREIHATHRDWQDVPIVVYHPSDPLTNQPLSANSPGVLDKSGIGFCCNPSFKGGKLRTELWIDVERAKRVDNRVLDAVNSGHPVELSTGLFTNNEPAPPGSSYNGVPFDYVAKDYRPDHLAILPDQVGACSIADGCGVLINRGASMKCSKCGSTMGCNAVGNCVACNDKHAPAPMENHEAALQSKLVDDTILSTQNVRQSFLGWIGSILGLNAKSSIHRRATGRYSPKVGTESKGKIPLAATQGYTGTTVEEVAPVSSGEMVEADDPDDHDPGSLFPEGFYGPGGARPMDSGGVSPDDSDGVNNANPEGINQYTRGANAASSRANLSDSKAEHIVAAGAHEEAAAAHREAGNINKAKAHEAAANEHMEVARTAVDGVAQRTAKTKTDFMRRPKPRDPMTGNSSDDAMKQEYLVYNARWPQERRDELPKSDFAGPHESFPIKSQKDVKSASVLAGHADDPEAVKSKIEAIAKRKGLKAPDSLTKNAGGGGQGGPSQTGSSRASSGAGTQAVSPLLDHAGRGPHSLFGGVDNDYREDTDRMNPMMISNTWTDEARQAAIEARRSTNRAHEASGKKAKVDPTGGHEHTPAITAALRAKVASSEAALGSKDPAASHLQAAQHHTIAADLEKTAGNHDAANAHTNAAALHIEAARLIGGIKHNQLQEDDTSNYNMTGDSNMTKCKLIDKLITNKKAVESDREMLNKMSPKVLKGILNAKMADDEDDNDDDDEEEDDDKDMEHNDDDAANIHSFDMPGPVQTGQRQAGGKGTRDEYNEVSAKPLDAVKNKKTVDWLKKAPPEVRSVVENAMNAEREQKQQLSVRLCANVAKDKKKATFNWFMAKPLAELKTLAAVFPASQQRNPIFNAVDDDAIPSMPALFGGVVINEQEKAANQGGLLEIPTLNFQELACEGIRKAIETGTLEKRASA
jgi:hypothetical protein